MYLSFLEVGFTALYICFWWQTLGQWIYISMIAMCLCKNFRIALNFKMCLSFLEKTGSSRPRFTLRYFSVNAFLKQLRTFYGLVWSYHHMLYIWIKFTHTLTSCRLLMRLLELWDPCLVNLLRNGLVLQGDCLLAFACHISTVWLLEVPLLLMYVVKWTSWCWVDLLDVFTFVLWRLQLG